MDLVKSLILNLSLIVAASFLSSFAYEKFYRNKRINFLLQILVFCSLTVYSVYNPVIVAKIFNFDARTILISISTFFFGWTVGIPIVITSIITRLTLNNVNIYVTILSALLPFLIGWLAHIKFKKRLIKINGLSIFIFALANSLIIFLMLYLLIIISLYNLINFEEFIKTQVAALLVFPLITLLIGLLINSSINKTNLFIKVQESESLLKATFQSINEGIIILDLDGKIISTNNVFENFFESDIKNKFFTDLVKIYDNETGEEIFISFKTVLVKNNSDLLNKRKILFKFGGKDMPAEMYFTNITDKEGKSIGYLVVLRDIREEIETKAKLLLSEKTFKGIFNSIQEAIYIQDENGLFIDVNDGAIKMYGYEKQDFINNSPAFLSAGYKNDNLDLKTILNKAYNGETQIFEFWGKKKDGTIFPKIVRLYPGEYFGKKVIIAVAVDISTLRLAQEKLIEQEKLLRILINATPDIIYVKDGNGKWIEMNKGIIELLGVNEEEIYQKDNLSIINSLNTLSQEILTGFEKLEERTWRDKSVKRNEHKIKLYNGYIRYFDIITIPLFNDDDSRKNMILIGRDITLMKKDEEEKQIMLNKLSSVIENFDGGVLVEDQFDKIEFVNDNFIKLFKLKQTKSNIKLLDTNVLFSLINNNIIDSENFLIIINDCKMIKSLKSGMEFNSKDKRIIETNYFPIFYEGALINHLWIFRDITETKMYEKKLKAQITELEKFNKSMVERELRMIELKKEVNELLSKSGMSPKYAILE